MKTTSIVTLILALALTTACDDGGTGGGGGAGGGGGNASIEVGNDSSHFSTFTETEAYEICESIGEQVADAYEIDDAKHGLCLWAGLMSKALSGGDNQVCQTAYDACMEEDLEQTDPPDDEPVQTEDPCEGIYEKVKDCDATIGELEACYEGQIALQQEAWDALQQYDCTSDMEALGETQGEDVAEPPTCTTLYDKCPALKDLD